MSKIKPQVDESHIIENDKYYKVVPRRHSERRGTDKLLEGDDIKVQKLERAFADIAGQGERRQADRRTSRPTLLSVDEIAILRKK